MSEWIESVLQGPFIDGFVPEDLKGTQSIDEFRARLLVVFAIGVVLIGCGASGVYLPLGVPHAFYAALIGAGFVMSGPLLMGWTGNLQLGSHVAAGALLATVFAICWLTGGIEAPGLMWMVTVPIFALVLNGAAAGVGWAIAVIAAAGILYGFEPVSHSVWIPHPFTMPQQHIARYVAVSSLAVVVFQFALLYGWLHLQLNRHLEEARDALEYRAYFDQLTGLPNRDEFQRRLKERITRARRGGSPFLYGFLDLDGFKVVNDSLGHPGGDRVIAMAAQRLQEAFDADDTVGRIGGDEFGILIDVDPTAGEREAVLNRLIDVFSEPFEVSDATVRLPASVGMARSEFCNLSRNSDEDVVEMLQRTADRAMFRAKQTPGTRVEFFNPADRGESDRRIQRENEIRNGVESGDFEAFYQPIVRVDDGRLVGAEILARWDHPERGILGPGEFLPIAYRSSLIHDVADSVVEAVCRDLETAPIPAVGGGPLCLQLNLSPEQLHAEDRLEQLLGRLTRGCVETVEISFEITESEWMKDDDGFELLESYGAELIIDDFGTGYSSLSRLASMPCRGLKLDREFIQGIDKNPQNEAMVRAVVQMGEALDLTVVAEGVETRAELEVIRTAGVEYAQGYYFARPMPFEALVDNHAVEQV
jgi:diguanylate cyclase (GGDEF)-like protein